MSGGDKGESCRTRLTHLMERAGYVYPDAVQVVATYPESTVKMILEIHERGVIIRNALPMHFHGWSEEQIASYLAYVKKGFSVTFSFTKSQAGIFPWQESRFDDL